MCSTVRASCNRLPYNTFRVVALEQLSSTNNPRVYMHHSSDFHSPRNVSGCFSLCFQSFTTFWSFFYQTSLFLWGDARARESMARVILGRWQPGLIQFTGGGPVALVSTGASSVKQCVNLLVNTSLDTWRCGNCVPDRREHCVCVDDASFLWNVSGWRGLWLILATRATHYCLLYHPLACSVLKDLRRNDSMLVRT